MSSRIFVIFLLIFSLKLVAVTVPLRHPVHVSVVNVDISDDGQISFSVKMFKDDFAKIINQINNTSIDFKENMPIQAVKKYVEDYVSENLQISESIDVKKNRYQLESYKINEESIWLYFKISTENKLSKAVGVRNSLMTDLYQDQTNLFILRYMAKEKAYSFNNSDRAFTFVFE